MKYVITFDQGTTSTRAILFDLEGRVISISQKEIKQTYPKEGYVLQDPEEIIDSVYSVLTDLVIKTKIKIDEVAGIGITNQRETTVIWNRETGMPIYPAIVWQSNQSQSICDELIKDHHQEMIQSKTGLLINPYFSGTKIKWILDLKDKDRQLSNSGQLMFGTIDTWLLWHLTGRKEHATDYSNASRTMLLNIHTLDYDEEILQILNIPRIILPEIKDSAGIFGYTDLSTVGMNGRIPIVSMIGDQQASLFGQTCFEPGEAKNTYGTGCFMLMNIGNHPSFSNQGLLTTIGWKIGSEITYALEGSVFIAGSAVKWLKNGIQMINHPSESEKLALEVHDSDGVVFVPSFVGLGTPYWDSRCKGGILGITQSTKRAHIARATLEGIAYQVSDVLKVMVNQSGVDVTTLRVDGKASENNLLLQFQSDILGVDVLRPTNVETTALGATYLAYIGLGIYNEKSVFKTFKNTYQVFKSQISVEDREKSLDKWNRAISSIKLF